MENKKAVIEAILFAVGKEVSIEQLMMALELPKDEIEHLLQEIQEEKNKNPQSGVELIKIDEKYQLATKKEYYEYIYPIVDQRAKPNLSNAALETLAIIAYNPRVTRAEIEAIRGVGADACIYKLMEYNLIEEAGKADLPGKPMTYKTNNEFLRMFGYSSLNDLPELPKYKLDANRQIIIDDLIEESENNETIKNGDGDN